MSRNPDIVARSLADASRELEGITQPNAVVSIGSPGTNPPLGFDPSDPLHLRLQFDDVTSERPSLRSEPAEPPRSGHIERLIERADQLLSTPIVYCHCAAGISRSTAAAFILHCLVHPEGQEDEAMRAVLEDNPFASPNRLMVKLADEVLDRQGRMVEAIEEVRRRLDAPFH